MPDEDLGIGIVHIGLGAFHRAHQAVYLDRWRERNAGGDWGICAANIRSNREIVAQLKAQGFQYHVAQFSDRNHVDIRVVRAIRHALFAGTDKTELLARMCRPTTRIVSLTVSEKGYYLSPASGELKLDEPDVAHDLAAPANPRTAPGLLLEALRQRRSRGLAPFTVLCCDNMPDNGNRTRRAVLTLASSQSAELAGWIDSAVAFPSTMVDRIVPAMTAAKRAELEALIGAPDRAAVACEAFSQWVIEDRFSCGRPDWEDDGVEMVDDVRPYETMKLRLLNGAHSLLAYVGLRNGESTVAAAIADQMLRRLVCDYFTETAHSLTLAPGMDTAAYARTLLARFGNDALEHQLHQIAMDGSQKLPQRWLEGAAINLESGATIRATAVGVAAWIAYVRGNNDAGDRWHVDDPLADVLANCHRRHSTAADVVAAVLGVREIFPETLSRHPDFRFAVQQAYLAMMASGRYAG